MVRSKCPSRRRRSQRRLLSFLLRQEADGIKTEINLYDMSRTLLGETTGSTGNLVKFPENRLVSVIATVQGTKLSVSEEGNALYRRIMDQLENRARFIETVLLSSEQTIDGHRNYRFLFLLALEETFNGILIRNEVEFGERTRILFKFSND